MRLALLEKTRYKQKIKTYTLTNYLFKIMKRIFSFFAVMLLVLTLHAEPAYRDWETDRKSTRLNSSHITRSRMPSSA